ITAPVGTWVFWIDQDEHLLRRLEYPVLGLREQLATTAPEPVKNLYLVADFTGARFDADLGDKAFAFEMPEQSRTVSEFQQPPPPPSPLLGQRVPPFEFKSLDDQPVTPESLAGK